MGIYSDVNGPCMFTLFRLRVETVLKAKSMVEVRGWNDPCPRFTITFKNDVAFTGSDPEQVILDAMVYRNTIFRLTGVLP